ncbi:uncharacterized protein BP5553_08723 [Venustampulla echinocandica]|uniref:Uncharacterized protein n=1 Tax=Venustampulla echinocandica TaxID=2656787 RepID=A0A370TF19_9HELO|nr:uncharacterized protein BP5553_08723 [Venustampulla echinocandica]RDL33284.1 hypothetical protein BP5553_08723 [Venustampulla echinocandica]
MSLSRIPLGQVFRAKANSTSSTNSSIPDLGNIVPRDVTKGSVATTASMAQQGQAPALSIRGTRTPKMLEYERQAEERAREQERMQDERDRMMEIEMRMAKEQERIAQEEYEMNQYYEAEALKHAEEMRLHQEEVRRHQDRVREHERKLQDHDASAEAFARVIAMPAKPGRDRQVSFLAPASMKNGKNGKNGNGMNINDMQNGNGNGMQNGMQNGNGFQNGNGLAPAQFPNGIWDLAGAEFYNGDAQYRCSENQFRNPWTESSTTHENELSIVSRWDTPFSLERTQQDNDGGSKHNVDAQRDLLDEANPFGSHANSLPRHRMSPPDSWSFQISVSVNGDLSTAAAAAVQVSATTEKWRGSSALS